MTSRGRASFRKGGGFRNFPAYRNAVSARDLASWNGIGLGQACCERSSEPCSERVRQVLRRLDALSESLQLRSCEDLRPSTPEVKSILGLDQTVKRFRVRATVVRAYKQAELLADAYSEFWSAVVDGAA
jgi:hypothetical protein